MAGVDADSRRKEVRVLVTEEVLPPRHDLHGTPHAVVQRVFTFEFARGTVVIDQTDYGHPGRFNPCHAKRVPAALQPGTPQLIAAAEALAVLLD